MIFTAFLLYVLFRASTWRELPVPSVLLVPSSSELASRGLAELLSDLHGLLYGNAIKTTNNNSSTLYAKVGNTLLFFFSGRVLLTLPTRFLFIVI